MKLVLVVATALCITSPAIAQTRVVDGDTIKVGPVTYRLHGIDAPESGQSCAAARGTWPCGKAATETLRRLLQAGQLACAPKGKDRYGRILAVCRAGGVDLNRAMVERGMAWSYRTYSHDYDAAEDVARGRRVGVWQAATEAPWDYRKGESRQAAATPQAAPAGCAIKGNIGATGARIYHLPTMRSYGPTRIDTAAGERWFCSEREAIAAGWRAPNG